MSEPAVRRVNPPSLAPPTGFSHAVVVEAGTPVHLAGQTALDASGAIVGKTLVEQFDQALGNLLTALRAAGGVPEHLTKVVLYVTDPADYKRHLADLGQVWRRQVGRDYPAMTLVGVTRLFDDEALVEIDAHAVVG